MASESSEVMEKGHIFFFYRPKVEEESPSDLDQVQRMYMVLKTGALMRLLVLGRKKLPDPTHKSRPYWAFVETVTDDASKLHDALSASDYSTATRGDRHQPGARVAGQGNYIILRHGESGSSKKSHTHLIYSLELPRGEPPPGSPQDQMNIAPEASFLLQVKNPTASNTTASSRAPSKKSEPFPKALQDKMGSLHFVPLDPPEFLNHEGCELLVIAASDDVAAELGEGVLDEVDHECEELKGGDEGVLGLLEDSRKGQEGLVKPLFEATWA